MKCLCWILTCVAGLAQNPADLMQFNVFTSNEVFAASPLSWYMSSVGVYTNGTTVPSDGGAVQQWLDVSGNNYHIGRSVLALRPLYNVSTNSINGYPSIWFWGKASLTNGAFASLRRSPYTVFVVFYVVSGFANGYLWSSTATVNPSMFLDALPTITLGATPTKRIMSNNWYVVSGTCMSNSPSLFMATNSCIYVNGKKMVQTQNNLAGADMLDFQVGGRLAAGGGIQGSISEVILFNRLLSESERIGVELYLRQKYAFTYPY